MIINKEILTAELKKLIDNILRLPEVACIKIRDVVIVDDAAKDAGIQMAVEKSYHDCFSDVDLCTVVRTAPHCAVNPDEYVRRIDRFGIRKEDWLGVSLEGNRLQRVVLKNGMRYDIGFEFETALDAPQIHFESLQEDAGNPDWPQRNVDRFWFVQIQALGKLYRKDYLISSHLANMNLNETLVQQMVLRDLEYGTDHHRYGYAETLAYRGNIGECPINTGDETFDLIADKLYCAALTYDELTKAFYPKYVGRCPDFMKIWNCYARSGGA